MFGPAPNQGILNTSSLKSILDPNMASVRDHTIGQLESVQERPFDVRSKSHNLRSLNSRRRLEEINRIEKENKKMAFRLFNVKPTVSLGEMQSEF